MNDKFGNTFQYVDFAGGLKIYNQCEKYVFACRAAV